MRNLIQGANYIQSHILHFYHLCALDYVDVTKVAAYEGRDPDLLSIKNFIERAVLHPFVPRYEGDYRLPAEVDQAAVKHYVQALEMRREAQELLAIYGGHMPHNMAVVPGGVTEVPTVSNITDFLWRLNKLRDFIDQVYIPDVLAIAGVYKDYFEIGAGCKRYLSYGVYDLDSQPDLTQRKRFHIQGTTTAADLKHKALDPSKISEDVKYSWYNSGTGLHPEQGETVPDPQKVDAYSWMKAPRYNGEANEVGPLARMLVSYTAGEPTVQKLVNDTLAHFNAPPTVLFSVLGRHAARALETKFIADVMADWVLQLKPGEPVYVDSKVPDSSEGVGLWEAPRGALGHWINIKEGVVANYQAVVPGTWNNSPRDDKGEPGPVEQALEGAPVHDEKNPFEIVRIVRSFDPCIACAVHLITPRGRSLGKFRVI